MGNFKLISVFARAIYDFHASGASGSSKNGSTRLRIEPLMGRVGVKGLGHARIQNLAYPWLLQVVQEVQATPVT